MQKRIKTGIASVLLVLVMVGAAEADLIGFEGIAPTSTPRQLDVDNTTIAFGNL